MNEKSKSWRALPVPPGDMQRLCDTANRELDTKDARIAELHARIAKLESTIGAVHEWTLRYGKELSPRGADTYGEGKRDAKEEVRSILKGVRERKTSHGEPK